MRPGLFDSTSSIRKSKLKQATFSLEANFGRIRTLPSQAEVELPPLPLWEESVGVGRAVEIRPFACWGTKPSHRSLFMILSPANPPWPLPGGEQSTVRRSPPWRGWGWVQGHELRASVRGISPGCKGKGSRHVAEAGPDAPVPRPGQLIKVARWLLVPLC